MILRRALSRLIKMALLLFCFYSFPMHSETSLVSTSNYSQNSSQSITNFALKLWKGGFGFIGNIITTKNHFPWNENEMDPMGPTEINYIGTAEDTVNTTIVFTKKDFKWDKNRLSLSVKRTVLVTSRGKTFSAQVDKSKNQVEVTISQQNEVLSRSNYEKIGYFQNSERTLFDFPTRAYLRGDGSLVSEEGHPLGFIIDSNGIKFCLVTETTGQILEIQNISNTLIVNGSSEMALYWEQHAKKKVHFISFFPGFSLIVPPEVGLNDLISTQEKENLIDPKVLMYLPDPILSAGIYTNPYKASYTKNQDSRTTCEEESLTPSNFVKSGRLASEVMGAIENITQQANRMGTKVNVLLIARSGTNPGSSHILKDYIQGKYLSLKDIRGDLNDDSSFGSVYNYIKQFSDPSRRLDYSHMALAFRRHPRGLKLQKEKNLPETPWTIVHLLKPCHSMKPELFEEGLWSFFLDDLYQYKAQIIVPNPQLQDRLEQLIITEKQADLFLGQKYNALALYDDPEEQNSNQWVLEVIASGLNPLASKNRDSAQTILKQLRYHPTRLQVAGKALFAKHFNLDSLNLSRQKYAQDNLVEVITVLSLQEFMMGQNQIMFQRDIEINPQNGMN